MHQAGQHMAILNTVVVVRTEHVGWNDGCELAAMLLFIRPTNTYMHHTPSYVLTANTHMYINSAQS